MDSLSQDVRLGLRTLLRVPLFTAAVVLTLGLGIGANAAVFTIVNRLLLKPLPVRDPASLQVLAVVHEGNESPHNVSWLDYQDYRANPVFQDLAAYDINFVGLSTEQRAERIAVSYVTSNFFSMLGISPAAGRLLQPGEAQQPGTDPVVVLGYSYWTRRFNRDPSVAGRRVIVNGQPFTIAGVVPESFQGVYALVEFDAYLPLTMLPQAEYHDKITKRDDHSLHVLGRLAPGVTRAQAQAAIDVQAKQLETKYPETNKTVRARLIPERQARPEANGADSTPAVAGIFLVLVALVLVVACVNVINLLMVRATVRQREIAVRAALGAARRRLIRQLLTESLLLAVMGGVAGAILGRWVIGVLSQIQLPGDLPFRFDFAFDWRVFGYIAAVALTAGVVVGILPALRASKTELNAVLREGGRGTSEGGRRQHVRSLLIVGQVAISLVLLVAAGLFVRSAMNAASVDLGFDPSHVMNASVDVAQQGYDEQRGRAFFDELLRRARQLPGVENASLAYSVPLGYYNLNAYLEIEGQPPSDKSRKPYGGYNVVSPEYLQTLRLRVVKGRFIQTQDDERSRPVAVVSEYMANRFWPGQDPIGRRFRSTDLGNRWIEIVGVVHDGKQTGLFADPAPYFYLPLAQSYRSLRVLQLRTAGDPAALASAVQREIRVLDPDLPVFDVTTMQRMLDGPNGFLLLRMGALFGGTMGLLGLILALVGIYGVVSYAASQRTQEIGVRMALGAARGDILRLVLGRGLVLVAIGLALGLVAAVSVSRLVSNLLFGVSAVDPVTFVVVPLALAAMALVASYVPAVRATRIDPAAALRAE
jgi:putative ABC transport system permease protein